MSAERADLSLAEEVLGITDRYNLQQAFAQASATLGYLTLDPRLLWPLGHDTQDRSLSVARRDARIVGEILLDKIEATSTLTDWLGYRYLMEAYGIKGDGNASALMIGALSGISSRSFVCLADNVYGANQAHITDPVETPVMASHGIFRRGSGLDMPYDSGSMDFVHTNRLLHMLEDPDSPSTPADYRRRKLMEEIKRVLKPGGQLLMNETINYVDGMPTDAVITECMRLGQEVLDSLKRSDICEIYVHPGFVPRDSGFLFVPQRELSKYPIELNLASVLVYARRRPDRIFFL